MLPQKLLTLVLVRNNGRILLGMKKRGFGAGKWNGFGGKVMEGETVEAAARRELAEESSLEASRLELRGIGHFRFVGDPTLIEVHMFEALDWRGEPKESEEMLPRWFNEDEIPFSEMWAADKHWYPHFLSQKRFFCEFHLEGEDLVSKHIELTPDDILA